MNIIWTIHTYKVNQFAIFLKISYNLFCLSTYTINYNINIAASSLFLHKLHLG